MPQEWKPPSYATPLQSSSSDTWQPPSYATGEPKKEEKKKSFFSSIADDLASFLESHPKLREGLQSGLTGTSPELEKAKRERAIQGLESDTSPDLHERIFPGSRERELARLREGGNVNVSGTPESEGSILPRIKQPETFAGGFLNSLYEDYIRPLGTPSGALGSSMPEHPLVSASANIARNAEGTGQRLLEAGPRFIGGPKGVQDIEEGLPIRQSREIPYQSPESYSTAELGRPRAKLYDPEAEYANYIKKMANEDMDASVKLGGTPRDIPDNPKALELERLRTGRSVPANLSVQDVMKPESLSMMDRMHAENAPIFRQMQESGMFSRNDLPIRNPQAMFKYMQPDELGNQFPMFDVQGSPGPMNPSGGSDLSLQSLGERGIDLAEGPLPANRTPPIRRSLSPFGEAEGTKAPSIFGSNRGSAQIIRGKGDFSEGPKGETARTLIRNLQKNLKSVTAGDPDTLEEITKLIAKDTSGIIKDKLVPDRLRGIVETLKDRASWARKNIAGDGVPGQQAKMESAAKYLETLAEEIQNSKEAPDKLLYKIRGILEQPAEKFKMNSLKSSLMDTLLGEEGSAKIIEDKKPLPPSKGPAGPAVDRLLSNIKQSKGIRTKQEGLYKQERARRFAAYENVETTGNQGSIERLGKLKGEYDKINRTALDMSPEETGSLFDAIKNSYLTTPEKIRAEVALHKIFEGGGVPQRNELKLLDDVFSDGFAEKFIEMHGGLGATGIKLGKIANTMKSMMGSTDLSAPLRQGAGLIHKKEWRDASREMFNYLGNKEYYNNAMQALQERPMAGLGRDSGLFLSKPGNLLSGEEAFGSSYVGDIPGVRDVVGASERSYTGFLNKLRADTFDNLIKNAEAMGHKVFDVVDGRKVPTKLANDIAKVINNSTGRGSLGEYGKFGHELNAIFWSPRLISSRLTMLNPKYYHDLDPFAKKEAIKSLLAIAAASTTINSLAAMGGAKIGYNILSSDFAKSRFKNNQVLDPNAGFQQPIVGAARMIAEANRMRTGAKKKNYNDPNLLEIPWRIATNKFSPLTGLAYDVATAKAFTGESKSSKDSPYFVPQQGGFTDRFGNKKYISTEVLKRFIPIFSQDVDSLLRNDPSFAESVGLGGAALFGAGVQDYPERTPNAPLRRKMSLSF